MLDIIPLTFRAACAYIEEHHRHNKPPRGMKFAIGCVVEGTTELVGVATAGRPVARVLDDGRTIEVNRTCTTGEYYNVNSMLYGACRRAAFAMGYKRVITYTQHDESGASLKAAGFVRVQELGVRGSWAYHSKKMKHTRDPIGNGGVARVRWECVRE